MISNSEILITQIKNVQPKFANEKIPLLGYKHSIHLLDQIPEKKLKNALKACGLEEGTQVFLLIDNTITGSSDNCVLFLDEYLYVRSSNLVEDDDEGILCFEWNEIDEIIFENKKFKIYFHDNQGDYTIDIDQTDFLNDDQSYLIQGLIQLIKDISKTISVAKNNDSSQKEIQRFESSTRNDKYVSMQNINQSGSSVKDDMENLISRALIDGELSDKERKVILNKASKLGFDPDEFEIELDARLFELKHSKKQAEIPEPVSFLVQKNENLTMPPVNSKKSIFNRIITKYYNYEEAYEKSIEILNEKENINNLIPKDLIRNYLSQEMSLKDIQNAVQTAINDIYSKFSRKHSFLRAINLLSMKPYVNPYKDHTLLLETISEGMSESEIKVVVEDCYSSHYSLFSPEEALSIAIPFIKRLGELNPKKKFDPNNPKQYHENEQLLKTFFEPQMSIPKIKELCILAFKNEFGKKGFLGQQPKIIDTATVPSPPSELSTIFYKGLTNVANSIADTTPGLINMALNKFIL